MSQKESPKLIGFTESTDYSGGYINYICPVTGKIAGNLLCDLPTEKNPFTCTTGACFCGSLSSGTAKGCPIGHTEFRGLKQGFVFIILHHDRGICEPKIFQLLMCSSKIEDSFCYNTLKLKTPKTRVVHGKSKGTPKRS